MGEELLVRCLTSFAKILDGHFLGIPDIDDFSNRAVERNQPEECFHGIADVAEAAGLLAIPINLDGRAIQSSFYKVGQNHTVAAGLAWTHGVEETRDDDGLVFLFPIGESEKLVERLGSGITPAPLGGRPEDQICIFVKWALACSCRKLPKWKR